MIILKNNESIEHIWAGQFLVGGDQKEVDNDYFRNALIDNTEFLQDLADGKAIINNGDHDLDPELGLLWLKEKVVHEVVSAMDISAIGENAPSLVLINGVMYGYEMSVGNKIYTRRQLEGIVAPHVSVVIRLGVNNIDANKWIQFRLHIITSIGYQDITLNADCTFLDFDAIEIPTTSLLICEMSKALPIQLFLNNEKNVFICLERILPEGKDSPTNNPIIIQVEFAYEKRTDL